MNSENPSTSSSVVPELVLKKGGRRSWAWLKWAIGLGLFLFMVGSVGSLALRVQKKADLTMATTNAHQLGMALLEFEDKYGRLPDATTAQAVKDKASTKWVLGDATSNELFRQLLATGIVPSEEIFYAKGAGNRKPDGKMIAETDAIATGECAFAYIPSDPSGNLTRPLALCPVLPGTHKFDPRPFGGKAVVIRRDYAVVTYTIAPDGRLALPGREDLLDPKHPIWDGKMPEVKWPDLLPPKNWIRFIVWICVGVIGAVLIILLIGVRRLSFNRPSSSTNDP